MPMPKMDSPRLDISQFKRMRAIIENECFMQDIEHSFVSKGCEYAFYEYQQNFDFAHCVNSGIAVAKKCQHNAKFPYGTPIDTSLIVQSHTSKFKPL